MTTHCRSRRHHRKAYRMLDALVRMEHVMFGSYNALMTCSMTSFMEIVPLCVLSITEGTINGQPRM